MNEYAATGIEVGKAEPREKQHELADFGGVHLLVKRNGAELWHFAFRLNGKGGTDSLGPYRPGGA